MLLFHASYREKKIFTIDFQKTELKLFERKKQNCQPLQKNKTLGDMEPMAEPVDSKPEARKVLRDLQLPAKTDATGKREGIGATSISV